MTQSSMFPVVYHFSPVFKPWLSPFQSAPSPVMYSSAYNVCETKFVYLPPCGGAQAELSSQHNLSSLHSPPLELRQRMGHKSEH